MPVLPMDLSRTRRRRSSFTKGQDPGFLHRETGTSLLYGSFFSCSSAILLFSSPIVSSRTLSSFFRNSSSSSLDGAKFRSEFHPPGGYSHRNPLPCRKKRNPPPLPPWPNPAPKPKPRQPLPGMALVNPGAPEPAQNPAALPVMGPYPEGPLLSPPGMMFTSSLCFCKIDLTRETR